MRIFASLIIAATCAAFSYPLYAQTCFGNCAQLENSEPMVQDAEAVMQRLNEHAQAYQRAEAAQIEAEQYEEASRIIINQPGSGLAPHELSDSAAIRAESRERRQAARLQQQRQDDCARLSLQRPGTGGLSTYAKNQLGC